MTAKWRCQSADRDALRELPSRDLCQGLVSPFTVGIREEVDGDLFERYPVPYCFHFCRAPRAAAIQSGVGTRAAAGCCDRLRTTELNTSTLFLCTVKRVASGRIGPLTKCLGQVEPR